MAHQYHKKFTLPRHADSFPAFLESVMYGIESETAANPLSKDLSFKIKWMLIELSTNGYKHSGTLETIIEIDIETGKVLVTKTDNNPQHPNFYNQLMAGNHHKTDIYSNPFDTLTAELLPGGTALLQVEKSPQKNEDIHGFNEHFGLLIITKSCHRFTYHFDKTTGSNVFTSLLNY